ncbi:MAG: SMP-30/gluconolactonase/LRE family protein [Gammaproteobacteria bacterium]|nr:SMP-30/gluconolactonase/LRE family protein [Gammaproteobacteria bacterium]
MKLNQIGWISCVLMGGFTGVALMLPAAFAEEPPEQVVAQAGWEFRVEAQNLSNIDNLVMADDGSVYATQEIPHRAGKIIRLNRGEITTVVSGLNRPDGLLLRGKSLFIVEETDNGRVLEYDLSAKKLRTLAVLNHPEGIDMFPDGDLVVSEDTTEGRLLRIRRDGRQAAQVILDELKRPEGLVVSPDGAIVFAETATGRVLSCRNGEVNVVVDDLANPDQVEWAPDGALWITEDVDDGRLLRLKDGTIETILSGLRSPQGMAFDAHGGVWLAERGRQRILVIHPRGRP